MASWKDIGEVPDSEDEGDLESHDRTAQSTQISNDHFDTSSRHGEKPQETQSRKKINSTGSALAAENRNKLTDVSSTRTVANNTGVPGITTPRVRSLSTNTLTWSPLSFEEESDNELAETSYNATDQSQQKAALPGGDDISTSYVRITGIGSLQSSPYENLLRSLSPEALSRKRKSDGHAVALLGETSPPPARKRSFRQRKQIQLHPYGIEQQKYQRTLKERGIAPIMISNSQEKRQNVHNSPPAESQVSDENPLEFDDTSDDGFTDYGESQVLGDRLLSSPRPYLRPSHVLPSQDLDQRVENTIDSDEDFPDIDEMLSRKPAVSSVRKKGILRTYSGRARKDASSRFTHVRHATQDSGDILDIPVSPPTTSPPAGAPGHQMPSSTASNSPMASYAVVIPPVQGLDIQQDSIPTPAASTTKPFPVVYIDSDSDVELSTSNGDAALGFNDASSSDESVELRKVGKRIKGVLPASHLRLETKRENRPRSPKPRRHTRSPSPVLRRGIAKPAMATRVPASASPLNAGMSFLEGFSDDEDENSSSHVYSDLNARTEEGIFPSPSRMDIAEEDNHIDVMLPSREIRKKQMKSKLFTSKKSKRISLTSPERQSDITEHFHIAALHKSRNHDTSRRGINTLKGSKQQGKPKKSRLAAPPPRLSILDVVENPADHETPLFIKIAARTARARRNFGRQSPSHKYIRLATREDTVDAQSVLHDWKSFKLKPKDLQFLRLNAVIGQHSGLHHIKDNQQTRLRSPQKKMQPRVRSSADSRPLGAKKLVVQPRLQKYIESFAHHRDIPVQEHITTVPKTKNQVSVTRLRKIPSHSTSRPAQLEGNGTSDISSSASPSFNLSKKLLDALYKSSRRHSSAGVTFPLNRFLIDNNVPLPSPESRTPNPTYQPSTLQKPPTAGAIDRRKKSQPKRYDVGASMYRQPENPMVLNYVEVETSALGNDSNDRLSGLGPYGTTYTIAFDIFPLPAGVFFNPTTFIGSGRLANILDSTSGATGAVTQSFTVSCGTRDFLWGPWNDVVSSEFGICFDWIVDQISTNETTSTENSLMSVAELLEKILAYFDSHVPGQASLDLSKVFIRITEVLQDFSKSILSCLQEVSMGKSHLPVLRNALLIYFRAVVISKNFSILSHYVFQLEDQLQTFARILVKVLLNIGLEDSRKLYDKVQFLTIRELGIRADDVATEAWVVLIQLLRRARIPKGSFWDVVNKEILDLRGFDCRDARVMEQLWYTMFSILPLCEFDDNGKVVPGQRHIVGFDNWTLPQQLLKAVFTLYKSSARQPPSFNDYSRALFHRCHLLMTTWGWWQCNAIIGTMFDFFASQNLGHLRNEEVYTSPQFLQELHLNPSLSVEAEDRCFHIFLKITAIGIKHLENVGQDKNVRNLVARLLPNHDRQYAKEEEVHQRDLASLRNHHDLLCTLYWAAPTRHRPSPALLEKLVVVEYSHSQACLINLRAWENLVRFVLSMASTEELFSPFSNWQRSALNALWGQYQDAETAVRRQAEDLAAANIFGITENQIKTTSSANRAATKSIIATMLQAMSHVCNINMTLAVAKKLFHIDLIARMLDNRPVDDFSDCLIKALTYYMQLLSRPINLNDSDDSQASEFEWEVVSRFDAISDFASTIVQPLQQHIRLILGIVPVRAIDRALVECWVSLVYMLSKESIQGFELHNFVGAGRYALFNHRKLLSIVENDFWTMFVSGMLLRTRADGRSVESLESSDFDVSSEWLRILVQPPSTVQVAAAVELSVQLHELGYCLLRLPVGIDGVALPSTDQDLNVRESALVRKFTPREILRWALSSMKGVVQGGPSFRPTNLSRSAAKDLFSWQLQYVMRTMQEQLQSMDHNSQQHKKYVEYVQAICETIQVYCSGIRPLESFFQSTGTYYWPPQSDPTRFAPLVKASALNLNGDNPSKAAKELFYFLVASFGQSLATGPLQSHFCNLSKAAREPSFLKFLVDELAAPMLEMGFAVHSVPAGWLFCAIYMPVIGNVLYELLQYPSMAIRLLHVANAQALVFHYAIKAAKAVIFYLQLHQSSYKSIDTGLMNSGYREILAISLDFWYTILPGLLRYQARVQDIAELEALKRAFNETAISIDQIMHNGEFSLTQRLFISTSDFRGLHYEEFRHGLETYVLENWTVGRADGTIVINKQGRKVEFGPIDGSVLKSVGSKSVGIRRPDLAGAIVHLKQTILDAKKSEESYSLLATYV